MIRNGLKYLWLMHKQWCWDRHGIGGTGIFNQTFLRDLDVFFVCFQMKCGDNTELSSGFCFHISIMHNYPREADAPGLGPLQTPKATVVQADRFVSKNASLKHAPGQ